ncbi:hypothetical protein OG21DRAFT_1514752 [Imleria badia]|nr:hypothetical protein OG21DRAFT_1514752 [Imleria badia]
MGFVHSCARIDTATRGEAIVTLRDSDLSGVKYQTSPELRMCEKDGEVINETSRAHSSPPHAQHATTPPSTSDGSVRVR